MAGQRRPLGGRRGRRASTGEPPDDGRPVDGAREADADPEQVARQICLHQLEHAPRTRAELAATLSDRGVPDDVAEHVLGRFTEVGLVDDALFAQMWVSSRHRSRGLAGRALSQELRGKGVDDDVVREAVGGLDAAMQEATARALVERRLAGTRGLPAQARVRRLAGLLARKGYGGELAYRVVREALQEECAETGAAGDLDLSLLDD